MFRRSIRDVRKMNRLAHLRARLLPTLSVNCRCGNLLSSTLNRLSPGINQLFSETCDHNCCHETHK